MRTGLAALVACMLLGMLAASATPAGSNVVKLDVPDVALVDQHQKKGRFVSDYIGGNLAVITFTYSSCTTVCPMLNGVFKQLQTRIADDLGNGTVLLTVSVDPVRDIPDRLKDHAQRLNARPGWSFLTGERETVNQLLKAVEVYAPVIQEHSPTVFVADGRRGVWTRLYGVPTSEQITQVLDAYEADRAGS